MCGGAEKNWVWLFSSIFLKAQTKCFFPPFLCVNRLDQKSFLRSDDRFNYIAFFVAQQIFREKKKESSASFRKSCLATLMHPGGFSARIIVT